MYAESRYSIFMLTANEAANEAAETLKPREVVYFLCLFYLCRKPYLELKLPVSFQVVPGEFHLPLSAVTGSWIL